MDTTVYCRRLGKEHACLQERHRKSREGVAIYRSLELNNVIIAVHKVVLEVC